MCKVGRFGSFLSLWLLVWVAVLPGQEEPGPWYLISEEELRSIERYKESIERERATWLVQARELRQRAESSEGRSVNLARESEHLNKQLVKQREVNRNLTESFNKLETDQLMQNSLKHGEIAELKQEVMKYKHQASKWWQWVIVGLGIAIAGHIALRVFFFR